MIRFFGASTVLLVFCLRLAAPPGAAGQTSQLAVAERSPSESSTNAAALKPGPEDGQIALATARVLEGLHYSHRHFDEALSSEFLDRYLDAMDPSHVNFLQSDLAQFEAYRTNLDNLTLRRGGADTAPAYEIFSRFLERLDPQVNYVMNLLTNEKFEFNSDDRIAVDRRKAPYPKNLDEAKQLWRERLRFEFLQEKLTREEAERSSTNKTASAATMNQEIVKTLARRYMLLWHVWKEQDANDVLVLHLTTLAHVYDPHSDYMGKDQFDNFAISMNNSLFGIGAQLGSEEDSTIRSPASGDSITNLLSNVEFHRYCSVRSLVPGGPAAKSKLLREKDRIIAVAQSNQPPVDVVDMSLNKVVDMIRGPKGTEVRLTVITNSAEDTKPIIVTLIRDEINLVDQAAKGEIIDLPTDKGGTMRLGIINLPSFYAPMESSLSKPPVSVSSNTNQPSLGRYTSADVARLLKKFEREKVKGVILDIRGNGGGVLEEAVKLTGLFIKEGPVVQVRDSLGRGGVLDDTDSSELYDGPLMVLTSHFSASASEILAGALQDYGRALIVGESSTHGKGTVQQLDKLKDILPRSNDSTNDFGTLKITIRKFYRPSGASTQLRGVLPDIVLPSVLNYSKDIGEGALDNPLPWDTTSSAKFEKMNRVQPYLPELLMRSADRMATNMDFVYVREDIEKYRKAQADKTISLNEQQRLREMQEDDARSKARDKERLARKEPEQTVYEIALKEADLPGLPPPVQRTNSVAMTNQKAVTGSLGTNSASNAKIPARKMPDANLAAEETKPPSVDTELNEAERILVDYLSLLSKGDTQVANH